MKHKTLAKISLCFVFVFGFTTVIGGAQAATPKATPSGSTAEQRLSQRKAERGIALDEKDVRRITTRCKQAQSDLIRTKQEFTGTVDRRNQAYERIDGRIVVIIGQLKLGNQDTFELEKRRTEYTELTTKFEALTKEFLLAMDDSAVVNCEADPNGFMALLQTSRLYMNEIRGQSEAIRVYLIDTVKPELSRLGEKL